MKFLTCSVFLALLSLTGCVGHPLLYGDDYNIRYTQVVMPTGYSQSGVTVQPFRGAFEKYRPVVRTETKVTEDTVKHNYDLDYSTKVTTIEGYDDLGRIVTLKIITDSKVDGGHRHQRVEEYDFQLWSYRDSDGGYFRGDGSFVSGESRYGDTPLHYHPGQGQPSAGSPRTGPRWPDGTPCNQGPPPQAPPSQEARQPEPQTQPATEPATLPADTAEPAIMVPAMPYTPESELTPSAPAAPAE